MPIYSDPNTLSTTAEALFTANFVKSASCTNPIEVVVRNNDASITIYIGNSNVTSAGAFGFTLIAGASLGFTITNPTDYKELYAVAASGTPVLGIFAIGPVGPNT